MFIMLLLEEFLQFLIIWAISTLLTGIVFSQYVIKYFGGLWINSGFILAIGFYILFKGLIGFGTKSQPQIA